MRKIFLTISTLLLIPSLIWAKEISFSDAKVWQYQNNELTSLDFNSVELTNWQTYQLKTIDLASDNIEELVVAAGRGHQPAVKILNSDGSLINSWLAYNAQMLNGVELAVGDVNNDNKQEIITGVGTGAGSHVRIFNSAGKLITAEGFFAFPGTNQGVKVAVLQANQDLNKEIATAIYQEGRVLVKIFDYLGNLLQEFIVPYDLGADFKISQIDLGGDNLDEIILTAGVNSFPQIYLYRIDGSLINNFLAYQEKFKGGFQVSMIDLDKDGQGEIITAPQLSGGPHIKIFDGYGNLKTEFMAYDQNMLAGINFTVLNDQVLFLPARQTTGRTDWEKYIAIDISEQLLTLYDYYGIATLKTPVSTGTVQMPTPLGEFTIGYKELNRYSKPYGLYMPYWMAFDVQRGFGIHELPYWPNGYKEGLDHLGQRVSHGCVRLGVGEAEKIYNQVPLGTKVIIQE